jgi:flavin-dependent dehydrogenase
MKRIHRDFVPEGSKIITGSRGGQYYINKHGEKVQITSAPRQPRRSFKARRGQFLRWLEAQSEIN